MSGEMRLSAPAEKPTVMPDHHSSILSARSQRQFGLWAAGGVFMMISSLFTRRAVARRFKSIRPPFFHPSNEPPVVTFNGPLEALEALTVASVNVFSFSVLMTGGLSWAFDISSMSEWRQRTRAKLGYEDTVAVEQSTDGGKTQDEWIVAVLDHEEAEMKRKKGG